MIDLCSATRIRAVEALVVCAVLTASAGAIAATAAADSLVFTILDEEGVPLSAGEMEFCLDDDCLFVELGASTGRFTVLPADIDPGKAYTVIYYDEQGRTVYAARGWRYVTESWDRGYDPELDADRKIITPTFTGTPDGQLVFSLNTEVNQAWQELRESAVAEVVRAERKQDTVAPPPRFMFSWRVPFVLGGKFGADTSFAGGVEDVKPGLAVGAAYLFGYGDGPGADSPQWLGYRALEVAYAGNRYDTYQLLAPGVLSDLTFHRLTLSLGVGRISRTSDWDLRAGVSVARGGIYDGRDVLSYQGRSYEMFGFGVYAQALRSIPLSAGTHVSLVCRLGYMHYTADAAEVDFWYGGLPTVSAGLVVF